MQPQGYNFFGQSPQPQAFSPSPQQLAEMMKLQEYNNPTSANAQASQGGGGMDPQMMAKMMMGNQSQTPVGVPSNAQSWNTGAGPLPWLAQNKLPWLA